MQRYFKMVKGSDDISCKATNRAPMPKISMKSLRVNTNKHAQSSSATDFDLELLFKNRGNLKRKGALKSANGREHFDKNSSLGLKSRKRPCSRELVPAAQPRRFDEGLPVYKSFGNFSDLSYGQRSSQEKPDGQCPFDCWCCF